MTNIRTEFFLYDGICLGVGVNYPNSFFVNVCNPHMRIIVAKLSNTHQQSSACLTGKQNYITRRET